MELLLFQIITSFYIERISILENDPEKFPFKGEEFVTGVLPFDLESGKGNRSTLSKVSEKLEGVQFEQIR